MKDISISKKLSILNLIMIVFSVTIALTSLIGMFISKQYFIKFIEKPYAASRQIKDCRTSVLYVSNYTNNIVNISDSSQTSDYENKVNTYKQEINKNLNLLENSYTEKNDLLQSYEAAINNWIGFIDRAISESKSGNKKEANRILSEDAPQALNKVTGFVIQLEDSISDIVENSKQSNINISNTVFIIIFVMLIVSQTSIIIIGQKTRTSIIKPLKEVEYASLELAKGNLNAQINYSSKNELGNLADATRNSISNLRTYIKDIDHVMNNLSKGNFDVRIEQPFVGDFKSIEISITSFINNINDMLKQINITSIQVAESTSQISDGAQILAEGSSEQTNELEKLSATVNEISEQIKQNAKNAVNAKNMSEKSGIEAQNGNEQMAKMIHAMTEIETASKQISNIIKTIDDIAYQTNILALNASIEAQRAGETGKGFSVVAENVKNLASKSILALKSTTELIGNSSRAVENGIKIVDETAKSLVTIVESTNQSIKLVNQIAHASTEQAESISDVTKNVDQITNVVQINSNTAEESASASEELFEQSNLLKELVSHFKLADS